MRPILPLASLWMRLGNFVSSFQKWQRPACYNFGCIFYGLHVAVHVCQMPTVHKVDSAKAALGRLDM